MDTTGFLLNEDELRDLSPSRILYYPTPTGWYAEVEHPPFDLPYDGRELTVFGPAAVLMEITTWVTKHLGVFHHRRFPFLHSSPTPIIAGSPIHPVAVPRMAGDYGIPLPRFMVLRDSCYDTQTDITFHMEIQRDDWLAVTGYRTGDFWSRSVTHSLDIDCPKRHRLNWDDLVGQVVRTLLRDHRLSYCPFLIDGLDGQPLSKDEMISRYQEARGVAQSLAECVALSPEMALR